MAARQGAFRCYYIRKFVLSQRETKLDHLAHRNRRALKIEDDTVACCDFLEVFRRHLPSKLLISHTFRFNLFL